MGFSPSEKHGTTTSIFSNIVDATTGTFTEGLTVSGTPVTLGPSSSVDSQALVKAWVNYSLTGGTPVIKRAFNVDSITDNGVGDVTINWTAGTFTTSDYSLAGIGRGVAATFGASMHEQQNTPVRTTSAVRIYSVNTENAVPGDAQRCSIIACE